MARNLGVTRAVTSARRTSVAVRLVACLVLVVTFIGAHASTDAGSASAPSASDTAALAAPQIKNAIVIIIDDGADIPCTKTGQFLPNVKKYIQDHGVCYDETMSPDPVCCPARAEIQTGQYGHNNGVERQVDADHIDMTHTIQSQLGQAGMATYGAGKDFNGIDPIRFYPPENLYNGFQDNDFSKSYDSKNFKLLRVGADGNGEYYKPATKLNTTLQTAKFMHDFVQREATAGRPFYGMFGFFAPHLQNFNNTAANNTPKEFPQPTHNNAKRAVPPFHFRPGHADGKLRFFQELPHHEPFYRSLYEHRTRAQYDVDDQVGKLFQQLDQLGILDTTAVIFMSDNGYSQNGEHNWNGKATPYPESTQVPLLAYIPGLVPEGKIVHTKTALVDVAPTLYDIFGITPNHVVDGHSLIDIAHGRHTRKVAFGEYRSEDSELVKQESGLGTSKLPSWHVVTMNGRSLVVWTMKNGTQHVEFYDDPHMDHDLLTKANAKKAPKKSTLAKYAKLMEQGIKCSGTKEQGSAHPCF